MTGEKYVEVSMVGGVALIVVGGAGGLMTVQHSPTIGYIQLAFGALGYLWFCSAGVVLSKRGFAWLIEKVRK